MPTMKVIQVDAPGADFRLVQREIPEPGDNEVLLQVQACGICHGDSVAKEGRFPGLSYPSVPGHEVVGTIHHLGSAVSSWSMGQRVGVGWHGGHCFHCGACRQGEFGACDEAVTTALTTDGGYAEYMIARAEALCAIPDGLDSVAAAPLLCAGSTTYGALRHSGARGGDLVAIHGLGGLGHLAVQYANKLGMRTVVLSRGQAKQELAQKLGAHAYIDTTATDPAQELQNLGGARLILCTAPNAQAIAGLVGGLGRHGQLLLVTFVGEPIPISPAFLLRGARSIAGWVGGNMDEAVRFSVLTGITPMVETFPLEQAALAYEKMMNSKVRFRSVLRMDT
jgi:propanol-preferring alcohol dehydrogenase